MNTEFLNKQLILMEEVTMSKRLLSMDFMRGFAIIATAMLHVVMLTSDLMERLGAVGPFGLPIEQFILVIFILIFAHFRGFFLMISAIVHVYAMTNALKKGISRGKLLVKQLLLGVIILAFSVFREIFLHEWSTPANLLIYGEFKLDETIWLAYLIEGLGGVAWGIIFTAITFYFLSAKGGVTKKIRNVIILAVLAALVVFSSDLLRNFIEEYSKMNLTDWGSTEIRPNQFDAPFNHWWNYITRFFISHFFGLEAPMFPMLAYVFVGIAYGFILNQDHVDRKFLRRGNLIGLALVILAFVWLLFVDGILAQLMVGDFSGLSALGDFHAHPIWYLLLAIGLQMIITDIMLAAFEFNTKIKIEKRLKRTKLVRRFGILALTVYGFASLQFLVRYLLWLIFPNIDFRTQPQSITGQTYRGTTLWIAVLTAVLVFLVWWGILMLWGKVGYKGSLEWGLAKLAGRKKGGNKKDPLNVEGNLDNVTPIMFVKPEHAEPGTYFLQGEEPPTE